MSDLAERREKIERRCDCIGHWPCDRCGWMADATDEIKQLREELVDRETRIHKQCERVKELREQVKHWEDKETHEAMDCYVDNEKLDKLERKNALLKLGLYRVIQNKPGHPTVLREIAEEVLLNAGYELPDESHWRKALEGKDDVTDKEWRERYGDE